jgi:hypothetical protein
MAAIMFKIGEKPKIYTIEGCLEVTRHPLIGFQIKIKPSTQPNYLNCQTKKQTKNCKEENRKDCPLYA